MLYIADYDMGWHWKIGASARKVRKDRFNLDTGDCRETVKELLALWVEEFLRKESDDVVVLLDQQNSIRK